MHVRLTYKSRPGVRADTDGTTVAFSSLIIIAAEPLAHVETAGTGQKKVAGAGWLRAPSDGGWRR